MTTVRNPYEPLLSMVKPRLIKSAIVSGDQLMAGMGGGMPPGIGGGMPPGMPPGAAGGGGMPPIDPSMMGGGGMPPMDPSMMGGGGMPPMDPSMMGGGMPPPPAPAGGGQLTADQIRSIVREELQGGGMAAGGAAKPKKSAGGDLAKQLGKIEKLLVYVIKQMHPDAPLELFQDNDQDQQQQQNGQQQQSQSKAGTQESAPGFENVGGIQPMQPLSGQLPGFPSLSAERKMAAESCPNCPVCGSDATSHVRSTEGNAQCQDCGHTFTDEEYGKTASDVAMLAMHGGIESPLPQRGELQSVSRAVLAMINAGR